MVKKITSYTLRRNFCHRAIEYCRRTDGSVDWAKAIQYTLHKNERSLRAAYEKRAADLADETDSAEQMNEE
jgi:hypothetical protein